MIRRTTSLFLLVAVTLVLGSCAGRRHISGRIAPNVASLSGFAAPDIPFTTADGVKTSLNKNRQPETILTFLPEDDHTSAKVRPSLAKLADEFAGFPLTIVQISVSPEEYT